MSKSVFPNCDGIVARLNTEGYCDDLLQSFRIWIDNDPLELPVTGFALEVGGNYQFLHTLNDFIYFYSFGDRVGELNVTGMAFIKRACNSGGGWDVTWPSYFNPANYNVNPFNSDFWNSPNWVHTKSAFLGFGRYQNSVCDLWDLYTRYRASAIAKKNRDAIKITWGICEAFHGFLTGMRVEIARPDIPIAQYVLRIHVVPKNQ